MTTEQAKQIRARHLMGHPVNALELQAAVLTLCQSKRSRRVCIPKLRAEVKERVNSVLLFNLGKAIGAMHG